MSAIAFAGTPDFAATILRRLLDAGRAVDHVLTQLDRPAGRGRRLEPSPVKRIALQAGIAVHQPASLRDAEQRAAILALDCDLLVVAAYGLILPAPVLEMAGARLRQRARVAAALLARKPFYPA